MTTEEIYISTKFVKDTLNNTNLEFNKINNIVGKYNYIYIFYSYNRPNDDELYDSVLPLLSKVYDDYKEELRKLKLKTIL